MTQRLGGLTASMICKSTSRNNTRYPELISVKAAQTRKLVPVVLTLCREYNDGGPRDVHRCVVVANLQRFQEIVEMNHQYLSAEHSDELLACTRRCLQHYTELSRDAALSGKLLWNIVPNSISGCTWPLRANGPIPKRAGLTPTRISWDASPP